MSTDRTPVRMTYEELQRLPDDGLRHELIDGALVVTPSPTTRHQQIVLTIASELVGVTRARRLGSVFVAPLDVFLADADVVEPDVLFVARDSQARIEKRRIAGPPDLVVEVTSPSTRRRDTLRKRQLYSSYGVREYWLVDPDTDSIRVFRRSGDSLTQVHELTAEAGDVLTTPLVPGFELSLAELFAPLELR